MEASGREIGRELAPTGDGVGTEQKMHAALVSLGFKPRREVDPAGGLTYKLCNCPYRDAVRENRDVVCRVKARSQNSTVATTIRHCPTFKSSG